MIIDVAKWFENPAMYDMNRDTLALCRAWLKEKMETEHSFIYSKQYKSFVAHHRDMISRLNEASNE